MALPDISPQAVSDGVLLSRLTTMRVGGPASRVLVAHSRDELLAHARECYDSGEDWLLLAGGSNTVVCDEGYPGTVLLVRSTGFAPVDDASLPVGLVRLRVAAGHDWDHLVQQTVSSGLAGLEALSGIPGRVGAAPVQNIGAYGAEVASVLHSVELLEEATGEVRRVPAEELALGYRTSALKTGALSGVILSVDVVLAHESVTGGVAPVRYPQLASALGVSVGERVPLATIRENVLRIRASKGMVLREDDHDSWSCGSFFVNPIVSEQFARTLPESAPRYITGPSPEAADAVTPLSELAAGTPLRLAEPAPAPQVKLSAAWLIEHSGIPRGYRLPGSGAALSRKHTLAITNRGGASAADVAELARFVVQRVQQEFGVILQPEPRLYGLEV